MRFLAPLVSRHSFKCIVASLVLVGLSLYALHETADVVSDIRELLSSEDSSSMENVKKAQRMFGQEPVLLVAIVRVEDETTGDMLSKPTLHAMATVMRQLMGVHAENPNNTAQEINWDYVCLRLNGRCFYSSPMQFWNDSDANIDKDNNPHWSILLRPRDEFYQVISEDLFGGLVRKGTAIQRATAARLTLLLDANTHPGAANEFENKFLDLCQNAQWPMGLQTRCFGLTMFDQVASEVSTYGMGPLSLAVIFELLFVGATVTGGLSPTRTSMMLGVAAVFVALAATGMGMGLASLFGIPLSPLCLQLVPLIALGTGVDGAFLLCHSLWGGGVVAGEDALEEHVAVTLQTSGKSVAVSCVAIALTFVVGSTAHLPIVHQLCLQMAVVIICNGLLLVFAFLPFAIIMYRKMRIFHDTNPSRPTIIVQSSLATLERVGRFVDKVGVRKGVLLGVVILAVVGGALLPFVSVGLDLEDLISQDSKPAQFMIWRKELFPSMTSLPVEFVVTGLNFTDVQSQVKMEKLHNSFQAYVPPFEKEGVIDWCMFLRIWNQLERPGQMFIPGDEFYPRLKEFLAGPGAAASLNLLYDADGNITASRILANSVSMGDAVGIVDTIRASRAISATAEMPVFAASGLFPLFEQFDSMAFDALWISTVACGVSLIASYLLLKSVKLAALGGVCVLVMLLDVAFFVVLARVKFNLLSLVNVMIAIAFCIEYYAHWASAYVHTDGGLSDQNNSSSSSSSDTLSTPLSKMSPYRRVCQPLVCAIASTTISLCFIAAVPQPFIRVYFVFAPLCVMAVDLFFVLLVLPSLMRIVQPGLLRSNGAVEWSSLEESTEMEPINTGNNNDEDNSLQSPTPEEEEGDDDEEAAAAVAKKEER